MTNPAGDPMQVRAIWPEGLAEAAQVVNQFAMADDATSADGIYFLLGHFVAPIFSSEEHAQQRLQQLDGAVTISPRGAFYMTRQNAKRLRDVLDGHLGRDSNGTNETGQET